jgi:hypothetical protein
MTNQSTPWLKKQLHIKHCLQDAKNAYWLNTATIFNHRQETAGLIQFRLN